MEPEGDASVSGREGGPADAPSGSHSDVDVTAPAGDGGVDACPGAVAPLPTMPAAHVARGAITVDGHGDDWPCTVHVSFDRTTAQATLNVNDAHADLAMAWSEDGVYFLVRSQSGRPPASAADPTKPYFSDGVELFLGVSPVQDNGLYREHDLQLIVDYLNHLTSYRQNQPFDAGAGNVITQASHDDKGFAIEAFFSAAAIGRASLTAGDLSFDVLLDQHGDAGDTQNAFWLYADRDASTPKGACGSVVSPSCNTRDWGTLRLVP